MDLKARTVRARLVPAAVAGALMLVVAVGSASAATWKVTEIPDGEVDAIFFGASCPSESFCVVTGTNSTVATSTDPDGGAAAWKLVHLEPVFVSPIPGPTMYHGNALRGVSCPSASFCAIAGPQGHLFTSTDPAAGAWVLTDLGLEATHMNGISCASPSQCVAVANNGKVIASANPTGGAGAWSVAKLPGTFDLRGVSCPTTSLCVAVGNEGSVFTSTDPTGGAGAWNLIGAPAGEGSLNDVDCASPVLCVSGNAAQILTSTNPTVGAAAWSAPLAGTGLPIKGVACPTTTACIAVDNNSDILTSTDPTSGRAAWSFVNVIPAPTSGRDETVNGMFAATCAGTRLCLAAGTRRQLLVSTDPFAADPEKRPIKKGKGRRPRVTITWHPPKRISPVRRGKRKVSFRFRAGGEVARFKCKLNREVDEQFTRGRYRPCKSPLHHRLKLGKYTFKVIAIGPTGDKSPPATFHFSVEFLREPGPAGTCSGKGRAKLFGRGCVTGR